MAWKLARWRQTNFQPDQSWDYSTAGEGEDLSVVGNQACPERSPPLMEDVTGRRAPPHQRPAAAPWERMVNGTPWEQQRLLEAIRPTHDCWVWIQQVHLGQQVLQVSLRQAGRLENETELLCEETEGNKSTYPEDIHFHRHDLLLPRRHCLSLISDFPGPHPRPGKTHAEIAPRADDRRIFLRTVESIPALLSTMQELH
jgi:hypothetical protein